MDSVGKDREVSPVGVETLLRPGAFPATLSSSGGERLHSTLPALDGELRAEEPTRIGRFVVLRRIGAGGMGVVYSAYDELLDRRLAIKLVRGEHYDPTAQTRMLREAQALGRLSHPNVVQVYEVGEFSGQIYVAMEFVRGETMRAWVAARRKGPAPVDTAAILEQFLAAGEGLVAAHAAGLVHRDFKPDNVLVGDEGRVRVVDFGLAAAAGATSTASEESLGDGSSDAFEAPLTQVGTVLGTPAYMAPEQLAGASSDARADIFSFAVALHEALFGARPFLGDTIQELLRNIHAKKRREPEVPRRRALAWVIPVIERGFAVDPDERWQTMGEFLEALRDNPARRRRRLKWILAMVASVVLAAAVLIIGQRVEARRCEGEAAAIDELWGVDERGQIELAVLGSGSPHAEPTWQRLSHRLDLWSRDWREARGEACRSGDEDGLAAARVACLDRQLWRFEGLLDGLGIASTATVNQSVAGVSRLDPVERCADLRWLDGAMRGEVGEVNSKALGLARRLARLRGLLSLGAFSEVATQIQPIQAALEGGSMPRLSAEARFIEGTAARKNGDFEVAAAAVADAYYRAGAIGDDRLAAEAAIIEMAILGVDLNRVEEADSWSANATMMLERAGLKDRDLGAMWEMIRGVLYRGKGEYDAALESYEAAKEIIVRDLGPRHPEISKIYANIASVHANRENFAEALANLRRGLEIFVESQGAHHPDVAVFHGNLGAILGEVGREEEALVEHRLAYATDRMTYGDAHPSVAYDLFNIGATLIELGEHGSAAENLAEAGVIMEEKLGPEHPMLGFVLCDQGRNFGYLGDIDRGIDLLERSEKIRVAAGDPGYIAISRFYLARLLWERPEQRSRAHELATFAQEVLSSEEHRDRKRLELVEAWLREHPAEESEEREESEESEEREEREVTTEAERGDVPLVEGVEP